MAIHGPRKESVVKKRDDTFYDILNDDRRKLWKDALKMMGITFIDYIPEDIVRDAINELHRRLEKKNAEDKH